MNKRILITGVAGFVGSHLADDLISKGYFVFGVDNFFRGKRENLKLIENNPNFILEEVDLSKEKSVSVIHDIILKNKIDTVIHLAAINGTQYFYDLPFFVFDQNISITKNILSAIENTSVRYILYSSSSEIYGDPKKIPTAESDPISLNALADRDSYAASKAMGDFYVRLFSRKYNIDYLILRIFNLYGERMVGTQYGQVIPEFAHKLMQDSPFTIIGDGSNTRSFCDIHDAIYIIRFLLEKNITGVINVGNDEETHILDLAKTMHQLLQKEFHPVFLPKRPNDHQRRCPNIDYLKSILPDLKLTSLEVGLKKILHLI